MRQYDTYKETCLKWVTHIPSHWEVVKVKYAYRFITGATPPTKVIEYFEGDNKWANISDIKEKVIYDTNKRLSDKGVEIARMTKSPKGSLFYSFKLSVGAVSFCGEEMYTNEAIASFLPGKNNLQYLYYLAPVAIIQNANVNIYGAYILNQELINNAFLLIPPLAEQQAIASYLDKKTSQIDRVIKSREAKIKLLEELKASIISNAVTKGIRKDVETKDSGIEWIGKIPKHWEIGRLKYVIKLINGRAYSQNELLEEGKYKVLRVGNFFTNEKWYYSNLELDKEKYCHQGDLLYAWSASFGPYIWNEDKTIYHYHIWKVRISEFYNKMYAYYVLDALSYFKRADVHGSTMTHITMESMNNTFIPIPSINEQISIVNYLENRLSIIKDQLTNCNKELSYLNEYRKSLITEVVTGKRKVI